MISVSLYWIYQRKTSTEFEDSIKPQLRRFWADRGDGSVRLLWYGLFRFASWSNVSANEGSTLIQLALPPHHAVGQQPLVSSQQKHTSSRDSFSYRNECSKSVHGELLVKLGTYLSVSLYGIQGYMQARLSESRLDCTPPVFE